MKASAAKANQLMREMVAATRLGQKALARNLLREIQEENPNNEQALLWSAALAESPDEATGYLEQVLSINPNNQQAINVLAIHRLNPVARISVALAGSSPASQPPRVAVPPLWVSEAPQPPAPVIPTSHAVPEPRPGSPHAPSACPVLRSDSVGTGSGSGLTRGQFPRIAEKDLAMSGLPGTGATDSAEMLDLRIAAGAGRFACPGRESRRRRKAAHHRAGAMAQARHRRADVRGVAQSHPDLLQPEPVGGGAAVPKKACELRPSETALQMVVSRLEQRRLLMAVDDSMTLRRILSIMLERHGYRVLTASDGMQALALLNEQTPDLILLDITMPRMDGYQVCKVIKQNPYTKRIPVVMLSGNDGFFDKVKGKLAGATDYITKPFDETALAASVQKHLKSVANSSVTPAR